MAAVHGEVAGEVGIEHAAELVRFTEAVMRDDDAELAQARDALRAVLSDEQFVDTCAVIGAFNVVDRIADSTGIPLDEPIKEISAEVREELDLGRFGSSKNTFPGGRVRS